jgi:hypothetical protein
VTGPTVVVSTEQRSNVSLTGVVWDTDHRLVVGATVEIMDGHQAGDSTVTDGTGRFELAVRFAGDMTTVRASKEGFLPATSTFVPANANRHIEFRLEPDRAR